MAQVETQEQADRLNAQGHTDAYIAANGHTMEANLRFPRLTVDRTDGERDLRVGDDVRSESWSAWCVDSCGACRDGEALPDW